MRFRVLPEANDEAASALTWYDDQCFGLGDDFLAELKSAYALIQENPDLIPRLERYHGPHALRRCLLRRFPYHVVFA